MGGITRRNKNNSHFDHNMIQTQVVKENKKMLNQ